ncbi:hypothetical protein P8452_22351 [Trifolium repens]|nr:hypothetical protein P8452_22351 [Trifolium repens]
MFQPPSSSNNQHLVHTKALSVQGTSALVPVDLEENSMDTKDNVKNEEFTKAEIFIRQSQNLQDDLHMLGMKIKQHEDRVTLLNTEKIKLNNSILHLQVAIGKSKSPSTTKIGNADDHRITTEEEVKTRHEEQASVLALAKDVVGIVAMLGKVEDSNLSRLFSEYLGVETMLAIVCRTYEGVKALEMYDTEGCINKSVGLHGLGATIGKPLDGRFLVICLESLRPYAGKHVIDDSQRKLDILNPRLPNGECPDGFIGFAVNMINIDSFNLFCVTPSGHGLRETLFYNLFSRLQVYKTRAEMIQALPCISDGALSLDGGMVRSCGVFSLGNREDINVRFPRPERSAGLDEHFEIERQMEDVQSKMKKLLGEFEREKAMLDIAKYNFNQKKIDFLKFLASSSSYATQVQTAPYVPR